MHFPVIVLVEGGVADAADAEAKASALLAPYDENGDGSRWDWWVVGGRWTGSLDGYEPHKDWRNVVGCNLCGGTGRRELDPTPVKVGDPFAAVTDGDETRPRWDPDSDWGRECGGCNQCHGLGWHLKWSCDPHPAGGDVQPVAVAIAAIQPYDEAAQTGFVPHAVVTPDGQWHENGRVGLWGVTIDNEQGVQPSEEGEEAWPEQAKRILGEHPNTTAVLVDCHV